MVKVKKRSEEFDKKKLDASVKKAGAKDEHTAKVADTSVICSIGRVNI